ncbi:hypothetical protein TIFTF001_020695 [Ficus carica]|uniref:Aminotransferase-like plant mobile domain-containing protein n=1 Tax=Ficus carica TaxID=3494 RepID=A0AA88AGL3_FICCA|nr:hypothetical protein TIFTF001_020695 [Ficus carica]
MEDPTDTDSIVETRQELIVSPTEQDLRPAHFLKPTAPTASIEEPPPPFSNSFTSKSRASKPRNSPPEVSFHGWLFPSENWKNWVEKMARKHRQTWEKAGIYEAIMGSTNKINKYPELVLELAKTWCPQTSSFAFRFAEATITLEDIMLCGGYSVLGRPVFDPPEAFLSRFEAEETREKEEKLNQERLLFVRSKGRKATQHAWMKRFMERESEVEHEAFLTLWLLRLARGTRIALAPVVLASIYRDLSYLKRKLFCSNDSEDGEEEEEIVVWAPFQLVLVWIWERFMLLQPERNLVEVGETTSTRLAQWHKVLKLESKDIKNEGLDEELESFARCLRPSELVGIDPPGHFVVPYLPHRVARQFGLDQDVPGSVIRCNQSHIVAWRSYDKPVNCEKLYIPSRFFISGVSARYFEWWNDSKPSDQDGVEPESVGVLKRHGEESSTSDCPGFSPKFCNRKRPMCEGSSSGVVKKKRMTESVEEKDAMKNKWKRLTEENEATCFPVRSWNSRKVEVRGSDPEDKLTLTELLRSRDVDGSVGKIRENGSHLNVEKKDDQTEPVVEKVYDRKRLREEDTESCPPGFSQKYKNKVEVRGSGPENKSTLNENKTKRSSEHNDAFRYPGFFKKCNKVEVGGSDLEDKLTLARMLRSQRTDGSVNGSRLPVMEPVKEEALEERLNDSEGESREVCEFDLDGMEKLEARIAKLENSIAKMKEARRDKMFWGAKKKTKEEPIDLD